MKLTLRNLLILAAAGFGILAFIMMFVTPIKIDDGWTTRNVKFNAVYFGSEGVKGAVISLIGFILILLGGLIFAASLFTNIGDNQIIMLGAIGLMIVGAILVFLTKTFLIAANPGWDEYMKQVLKLGAGPILGGICGILGALCGGAATFVFKD